MAAYSARTLLLLLLLWGLPCASRGGGLSQDAQSSIEITQVDLFSIKEWDSAHVAFLGFRLGMERREAFRNAQNGGLTMDDDSGQGCLKAETCHLLDFGKYIGLALTFGIRDTIQRIRVEMPSSNPSKEEMENWLVKKMPGQTREFFENYSDSLRARLLGIANANWFDAPRAEAWPNEHANQEYQYYSKGLILHIRSKTTRPSEMPQKTQVAADFLYPK